MKIDIYRSTKNRSKFLSVPAGTEVAKMPFPAKLDLDLRNVFRFKCEHEIIPNKHYIALDAQDVVNQIESNGFAQHSATITATTTVVSKRGFSTRFTP
jgi:hypothetical protein